MAIIAFLSLPPRKRHLPQYMRLLFMVVLGFAICLVCLVNTNKPNQKHYMESNWMLPTICIIFFVCVVVTHARPPIRWGWGHKRDGA
jgi:peptidoglycan/LPS O-acetylase OafA/YrhL